MFPLPWDKVQDVVMKTGLNESVIYYVTSGRREPKISTAAKIAEGLGISLGRFYNEWRKVRAS